MEGFNFGWIWSRLAPCAVCRVPCAAWDSNIADRHHLDAVLPSPACVAILILKPSDWEHRSDQTAHEHIRAFRRGHRPTLARSGICILAGGAPRVETLCCDSPRLPIKSERHPPFQLMFALYTPFSP